jgi:hypothetical protein
MGCCGHGGDVPGGFFTNVLAICSFLLGFEVQQRETYGEDDCSNVVVEAGCADGFLVSARSTGLVGQNESSTDPHGRGTEHESSSQGLAVEDTASGNDLHGLAGHGGCLALAELDNSWDENGGWHVTGVAATLTTLGADEIDAEFEALLDMFGVSDHVHVQDTVLVEPVNDMLGGNTDGGDEEPGARLDDDVYELVKLSLCVVVAGAVFVSFFFLLGGGRFDLSTDFVLRAFPPTWGSRRSTPKGAFLSFKCPLSSAICSLNISGV